MTGTTFDTSRGPDNVRRLGIRRAGESVTAYHTEAELMTLHLQGDDSAAVGLNLLRMVNSANRPVMERVAEARANNKKASPPAGD